MSNAVTVQGMNPARVEISDCLKCGAVLPGTWPSMMIEAPDAEFRYRLCKACVQHYFVGSSDEVASWKRDLWGRLERITEGMLRNAELMMGEPRETMQ